MNKIVSLVNEWDAFEKNHPGAEIADFCRYYLLNEKQQDEQEMVKGMRPPSERSLLIKTMAFVISAYNIYFRAAMAETKLPFPEAFFYLVNLYHMKGARKTDLVNSIMVEYTTGIDAIGKLIKAGLISEKPDNNDKRAKLIQITAKGEKALQSCHPLVGKATEMIFKDLDSDTLKLCISLLSRIEVKHSSLSIAVRHLGFDEMYAKVMSEN